MEKIIGVDFDNTIVRYGALVHRIAVEWGLVQENTEKDKKVIRDRIRLLPNGDVEWQKVQAEVYGPRMKEAELIEGVSEFLAQCRQNNIQIFIVSHKTQYAHYDRTGTELRTAALEWMESKTFFADTGWGILRENVFFESTRVEKVDRIKRLRCTHFIDDLEEVFAEASFPENTEKILFDTQGRRAELAGIRMATSWKEIGDHFFRAAC
jgi:hypothetical protein